ncbi:MAG: ferredoxin--NADP reductase [Acidimicrobiales bacterium]
MATTYVRLPVDERNFKGHDPRGRPSEIRDAADDPLNDRWRHAKSYERQAVVLSVDALTDTGTFAVTFEVVDGQSFQYLPGQFIGIEADVAGVRRRRTPYCVLWASEDETAFTLLIRVTPDGPLSQYITGLAPGDIVEFRSATGRTMIPKEDDTDLVLVATGVGVSPLYSLASYLLDEEGTSRHITLLWGLRLSDDICLQPALDDLAARHANFEYHISLSQPDDTWSGLRGRVTETAPEVIGSLERTHFILCGNGAMINELGPALRLAGVKEWLVYEEPFFNTRVKADTGDILALRDRLTGGHIDSPVLAGRGELFVLERPIIPRRLAS